MTDREIIELAKSSGIVTGENLRRGDDYLFRSMGTPTNVFGAHLIDFARAVWACGYAAGTAGVAPTHEPIAQIRGGDVYWLVDDGKPLPEGAYLYAAAGVALPLAAQPSEGSDAA